MLSPVEGSAEEKLKQQLCPALSHEGLNGVSSWPGDARGERCTDSI